MTAKTRTQRFPILMSPLWRLLLRPLGATPDNCYVEVKGDKLHVRFGPRFDYRFPLDGVETVTLGHWPLWAGIGPRYFRGTMGLVGTYVNIVEVRFKEPQRVRMLLPFKCERLFLSLEEPRDLMAAVTRRTAVESKAA